LRRLESVDSVLAAASTSDEAAPVSIAALHVRDVGRHLLRAVRSPLNVAEIFCGAERALGAVDEVRQIPRQQH
jgi:ribosomal protein S28E/S33